LKSKITHPLERTDLQVGDGAYLSNSYSEVSFQPADHTVRAENRLVDRERGRGGREREAGEGETRGRGEREEGEGEARGRGKKER
jgi:hypothetical protein